MATTDPALNRWVSGQSRSQLTLYSQTHQSTLRRDIAFFFENRQKPHFIVYTPPVRGRIESRKIRTTTTLNRYLDFPHVGLASWLDGKTWFNTCAGVGGDISFSQGCMGVLRLNRASPWNGESAGWSLCQILHSRSTLQCSKKNAGSLGGAPSSSRPPYPDMHDIMDEVFQIMSKKREWRLSKDSLHGICAG